MLRRRRRGSMLCTGLLTLARGTASIRANARLYTPGSALVSSQAVAGLTAEQQHYLASVMRVRAGDEVLVFNGVDGEWSATVEAVDKRRCQLRVNGRTRQQPPPSEAAGAPTLLFAVLRSARLSTLVEKATELGVGELRPVVTQNCAVRKLNVPRLQAVANEASEQSRRLTVPGISEPEALPSALDGWDAQRPLCVCDERGGAPPLSALVADGLLAGEAGGPGLLIGPEGGFAPEEFQALADLPFVRLVSLGQNTLRAETAALAACAVLACR